MRLKHGTWVYSKSRPFTSTAGPMVPYLDFCRVGGWKDGRLGSVGIFVTGRCAVVGLLPRFADPAHLRHQFSIHVRTLQGAPT